MLLYIFSGNDYLHDITSGQQYVLRIDMEDFENERRYAVYSNFSIASERDKYTLSLGEYNGTAGNPKPHTRAHAHTRTRAHGHTRTRAHAHTRTRAHAHTRTRAHAHTRTRAHAHIIVAYG